MFLFFFVVSMLAPLIMSFSLGEASRYMWAGLVVVCGLGSIGAWAMTRQHGELNIREGFFVVVLTWVGLSCFGSLPFILSGVIPNWAGAFFETMSGLTTTGATVIEGIEGIDMSILLWRSIIQWLGGMGVVVLSVAIFPLIGIGGFQLFKAEVPGPQHDRLTPRITQTAKVLWGIYILFTIAETVCLKCGGMNFFEAVCHSFTTMSTGGFSTRTASIAAFKSPYIESIITLFMFFAGVNFSLYFLMLRGKLTAFWRDGEFKAYCVIFIVAALCISANVYHVYGNVLSSLRAAIFQVVSVGTTTGYCTENFELWPTFSKYLLVLLMFIGGCAGSTAGGIKVFRVYVLCKQATIEIKKAVYSKIVTPIRIGNSTVLPETVAAIQGFFLLFMLVFVGATIIMALLGLDIVTAFSSVIACLANIGPGLAKVGAIENYGHIPDIGKIVLSMCMLLGRLEIYTVLVVVLPNVWRD